RAARRVRRDALAAARAPAGVASEHAGERRRARSRPAEPKLSGGYETGGASAAPAGATVAVGSCAGARERRSAFAAHTTAAPVATRTIAAARRLPRRRLGGSPSATC